MGGMTLTDQPFRDVLPTASHGMENLMNDNLPPAVSVLIPMYDRAWSIRDCLSSIRGLDRLPAEVIIVDDGSSDGSVEIARQSIEDLGIGHCTRLITQANGGPGAARNRAAAEARGDWLIFFDSDDLWMPWTLDVLVEQLSTVTPETELAFFAIRSFVHPEELAAERGEVVVTPQPDFLQAVRRHPGIRYGSCNAAIRREVFARVGGFSTNLRSAEDTDLFLRIGGPTLVIRRPLMAGLRRAGQDSLTGNIPKIVEGFGYLAQETAAGRYPGSQGELREFVAKSCAYTIRSSFASGWPGAAYRLYFSNLGLLFGGRQRPYFWRLPVTPLLHLVNPRSYPFRIRPQGAPNR
jgi:hypothetical protein